MNVNSGLRTTGLALHVITSVGWLGAVAAFLALSVTGALSSNAGLVSSVDIAMRVVTWWLIVPLALLSPLTGLVQSLITPWGLVRHYWVIVKLVMTLPATAILLLHTGPIGQIAEAAGAFDGSIAGLRRQMLYASVAAIVVLVTATLLSFYKPRGMTGPGAKRIAAASRA